MQKAVAALEKNVEWIALGLAGIWVLWVVWAYVITKPVSVEIGDDAVSAASVDEVIRKEAAERLAARLTDPPGPPPTIPVPQIELAWAVTAPPPLPSPPIDSPIVRQRSIEEQLPIDPRNPNAPRVLPSGDKVAQLPEIPAPRIVDVVADKGQIIPPELPQHDMNRAGFDGNVAAQPLLPPQPLQQVAPNLGGLGNANPQNVNAKDAWWVWVTAKFDEAAVQQAYQAANVPPHLSRMEYLAVELQREELLPDGTWGNAKMIPPLKHNAPPPEFDRQNAPMEYLTWALQNPENQYLILEPPFYQTLGTRKIPLHLQPKVQTIADTSMLSQFQDMKSLADQIENGNMLPIELKQIEDRLSQQQKQELYRERQAIRAEKQRQEAEQRRSQQQQNRTERRSTRGGRSYAPIDPELMGEMLASGGAPVGRRTYDDPRMGNYPSRGSMPIPMVNPVDPTQMNVTRPGGILHPDGRTAYGEFDVWAYDETVEPGKTYRYRMRLVLKNPVFRIKGAVADDKLAQVMELPVSKDQGWSDWSRPVVVERGVEMFFAGTGRNSENVRFDIYRWQDGRVNKQQFTAAPGDVIGTMDQKTNIDFNTGYAVVDVRQIASRDYRVTLIDPNGTQVVRTYQEDINNPKRAALEAEASKPANPALTDLRS